MGDGIDHTRTARPPIGRVLGLVPARGGSKGIPRKNIRELCGRPLLWYTARAALRARRLSRVVLSTDDLEIAEVGRQCGLEASFVRPADLARDDTPMLPVVQHTLQVLEAKGDRFDAVCLLQPTSPLRGARDIDACVALLEVTGADSVVSTLPVPQRYNPHWVYFVNDDGSLRLSTAEGAPIASRQALPAAVHREGSVYVIRCDALRESGTLYGARVVGYPMDPSRSVNIDDAADWAEAERLVGALAEVH